MSSTPSDPHTLTNKLNHLLQAIHLPFTLQSPVDLTPSLLLAILESILRVRIPIDLDHSPYSPSGGSVTQTRHIQTIKVFLGVLETDVLKTDVGLSKLDPRLLAAGAWDEVVYVAEVLCWIGEELGLVPSTPVLDNQKDKGKGRARDTAEPYSNETQTTSLPTSSSLGLAPSPSTSQTTPHDQVQPSPSSSSTITFLPPFTEVPLPPTPTTTSLLFTTDLDDTLHTTIASPLATSSPFRQSTSKTKIPTSQCPQSSPRTTRLQHADIPPDDSSFTRQTPPIRRTGYISLVDHDSELSSFFAHSLSLSPPAASSPRDQTHKQSPPPGPRTPTRPKPQSKPRPQPRSTPTPSTRHPEPSSRDWKALLSESPDYDPRRTYLLLQQRTELMEELLRIRMSQRPS